MKHLPLLQDLIHKNKRNPNSEVWDSWMLRGGTVNMKHFTDQRMDVSFTHVGSKADSEE